eukprot:s4229_g10.t1
MSMARSMVQNFELNELSPDARDLLADRFELMKEIMTQVVIQAEFSEQAALVNFLHRVLCTIRALFLDWEVPAALETDTLETDLPAFKDTWRVQHPTPAVLFKEISTTLEFMREHATFFSEEPWAWLMQFMAAVHGDLEQKVVTVLTFDTGSGHRFPRSISHALKAKDHYEEALLANVQNPYVDVQYLRQKMGLASASSMSPYVDVNNLQCNMGLSSSTSLGTAVQEPRDLRAAWKSLSANEKLEYRGRRDYEQSVHGIKRDRAGVRKNMRYRHLFYIFLELVKNAARASIERAQLEGLLEDTFAGNGNGDSKAEIPSIHVTVPEDREQGIWDHERSVKLADHGTGMNRRVLSKAFSYFYSSVKARPTIAAEVSDFDRRMPLAGFGFGLPISRVMARYFAGDIDVNSIPGQGTDVYVYL